jgi:hypothetical protein
MLDELPALGDAAVCGDGPSAARWLADALREQGLGNAVTTLAELPAQAGPPIGLLWVSAVPEMSVVDRLAPYADVLATALAPRSLVVADVNTRLTGQVDELLALLPDGFVRCPSTSPTMVVLRREGV